MLIKCYLTIERVQTKSFHLRQRQDLYCSPSKDHQKRLNEIVNRNDTAQLLYFTDVPCTICTSSFLKGETGGNVELEVGAQG